MSKWVFWCGAVVFLYTMITAGFVWHFVMGSKGGVYSDAKQRGVPLNTVEWKNEDGQTLRADYAETPGRPTIILAHGHKAARGQLSPLLATLYLQCRFGVLAFDFRGCGESDGSFSACGAQEGRDLSSAIRFLKARGLSAKEIGVVGFGMGGVAALSISGQVNELGAVVIMAAGESPRRFLERKVKGLGLPPTPTASLAFVLSERIAGVRLDSVDIGAGWRGLSDVPTLICGGKDDTLCPPELLEAAFRTVRSSSKEIELFPNRDHHGLVSPEASDVLQRVRGFLVKHLAD